MSHVEPSVSLRVSRGACRLDTRSPGWAPTIDRAILKIYDCLECTLGQIFGSYSEGLAALGLDFLEAHAYGFIRKPGLLGLERDAEYAELAACWKAEIASRLVPVLPKVTCPVAGSDAELFATLTAGGVGMLVGV